MKNLKYFIAAFVVAILMSTSLDVNAQSQRRGNNQYHGNNDYNDRDYDHHDHHCNDRSCNHDNNTYYGRNGGNNGRYNSRYFENITRQYMRHYDRYFMGARSYRAQQIAARNFDIHVRHCNICQKYLNTVANNSRNRGVRVVGSGGYYGR